MPMEKLYYLTWLNITYAFLVNKSIDVDGVSPPPQLYSEFLGIAMGRNHLLEQFAQLKLKNIGEIMRCRWFLNGI